MLSFAKLAGMDQRYYLDQAQGRVDHTDSVSSGAEDYFLSGAEAAGRWMGSAAGALGLSGEVSEAELRAVLSKQDARTGVLLAGSVRRARVPGFDLMFCTTPAGPAVRRAAARSRPAMGSSARRFAIGQAVPVILGEQIAWRRAQRDLTRSQVDLGQPGARERGGHAIEL